jgi:hypothetical protein
MNRGPRIRTGGLRLSALFMVLLAAACAPAPALPPDPVGPDVVLDTYLRALLAGDCDTGRKVATQSFAKGNGELCGDTHVTRYRIDPGAARPSSDEIVFSTHLITSGTDDGSIESGEMMWFYSLTRQSDGSWRIAGGGSGP